MKRGPNTERGIAMSGQITPQDAAMLAQLRRKQAMKDEYLHAQNESPLLQEAEKLLALADMARESKPGPRFAVQLEKETRFIRSLQEEMRSDYEALPPLIKNGPAGSAAKNSVILLEAALRRVSQAATEENTADLLEEAAFLLHGAGE